jgi:flagellar basal body P-ring protein FlgI
MLNVPVGVAVLEPEAEATVIVMGSPTPAAGVVVCGKSVVVEAVTVGEEATTFTVRDPLEVA